MAESVYEVKVVSSKDNDKFALYWDTMIAEIAMACRVPPDQLMRGYPSEYSALGEAINATKKHT